MRLFLKREIRQALNYAKEGGQALHLWKPDYRLYSNAPLCFLLTPGEWAHLIDYDKERLIKTAKQLGVKLIRIDREGRRGQHIDLCGRPLKKAKVMCEKR